MHAILEHSDITIEEVFAFLTGSSFPPPVGFDCEPSILFCEENCLPVVATCSLTLTFSRTYGSLSFSEFASKLNFAISEAKEFGLI